MHNPGLAFLGNASLANDTEAAEVQCKSHGARICSLGTLSDKNHQSCGARPALPP